MIVYLHHNIFLILSLFLKAKKYPEAKKKHLYGYVISARNEEKVIGNLIDSILKQDYPKELMRVFVIADNCTDDTAKVAREKGATVIERHDTKLIGKSYALDMVFKFILKTDKDIEAFIVFDADNLVDPNFTKEMNKAYDSGVMLATSFRNAKNYGQNWLTSGAAMTFLRECRIMHRVRSALNISCYISGTGFLVDRNIIARLNGWPYHCLIEDVEFSLGEYLKGQKTGYVEKAVFFDEHPSKLKASINQRLRWCRGNHQCSGKYQFKLLRNFFKTGDFSNIDLGAHIFPGPMLIFCWLLLLPIIYGIYALIAHVDAHTWVVASVYPLLDSMLYGGIYAILLAILLTIMLWKELNTTWYKKIWHCFTFPIYMLTYLPITTLAAFIKVKWVPIVHNDAITIDQIEAEVKE